MLLADLSAPVILQFFDGSYDTIERRTADIFTAGYGSVNLREPRNVAPGGVEPPHSTARLTQV